MKRTLLLSAIIIIAITCQMCKNTPRDKHRVKTVIFYRKDTNQDSIGYRIDNGVIIGKLDKNKFLADTTEYTYNADGHVAHVRFSWNRSKYDYQYLNDKIVRRYYNQEKNNTQMDTFFLNKRGLVEKMTSDDPSGKTMIRQYNTDGYLKVMVFGENDSNTCEYHSGNEISNTMIDSGKIKSTNAYTYYLDKINTIGDDNMGSEFLGISCKNPIKNSYFSLAGEDPLITNHIYQYDKKGRIISQAVYAYDYYNRLIDSTTYSYY